MPPWTGEASDCRFAAGDIVGFVRYGEFRWGIVFDGQWHPAHGGWWTVDMVTDGHWHPYGCELFRIPQPVPRATRTALQACLREAIREKAAWEASDDCTRHHLSQPKAMLPV